jgi:hypothetical protein
MEIEIKGLDQLTRAFEALPQIAIPAAEEAMKKSLFAISERAVDYPPSSAANQPGRINSKGKPIGYYERGRGWWYPVRRRATLPAGTTRARTKKNAVTTTRRERAISGVVGYKLAGGGKSQLMKDSWTESIASDNRGVVGRLGTRVTYSPYVIGSRQARIHEARGWNRIDRAIEQSAEDIKAAWDEAVTKIIKAFGGYRNGSN